MSFESLLNLTFDSFRPTRTRGVQGDWPSTLEPRLLAQPCTYKRMIPREAFQVFAERKEDKTFYIVYMAVGIDVQEEDVLELSDGLRGIVTRIDDQAGRLHHWAVYMDVRTPCG